MQPRQLLDFLGTIEKLKCTLRHSWTSNGRQESVAEHSWRLAVMALLVADEFEKADMEKVVKMCLIHDFGEAVTGDIPSFNKTDSDEEKEAAAIEDMLSSLPEKLSCEFSELFHEMQQLDTLEAKIFKALDNLEAIISHNEAPLDTWLPLEYTENQTYGADKVAFSEYLKELKEETRQDTLRKIGQ